MRFREIHKRLILISPKPRYIHHTAVGLQRKSVEGATEINHAEFLTTAKAESDFNPQQQPLAGSSTASTSQGRLDPTNSHLFKLILPLPTSLLRSKTLSNPTSRKPTAFLLHPSQPLSHLSRLIVGSLPPSERNADITYLALTGKEDDLEDHLRSAESETDKPTQRQEGGPYLGEREKDKGRWQEVSWSQSTDLSDFIKQSCLNERFKIVIEPEVREEEGKGKEKAVEQGQGSENEGVMIEVVIPSFASRTTFLRERLLRLTKDLDKMTKQKKAIDLSAHKSAQRLGTGALAVGAIYWGAVVRWTFFTDAGWDLMEPVTWATGFMALLCGTGFLIYHNREVSYSSLLDLSVTARQRSLYDKHGLDIEKWTEMVSEAKTLRREIARIAADYDIEWKGELETLATMEKYSHPSSRLHPDSSKSSQPDPNPGEASPSNNEDPPRDEDGEKIDIDKTIDEASEMAERTKVKEDKAKDAERKGEAVDERRDKEGGKDKEEKGESRGREKARRLVEKAEG